MSDDDCGCCEGVGNATPEAIDNPPGRSSLSYRIGTYGTFFRTMMARLGALQAELGAVGSAAARQGEAGCLGESHRTFLLGGEPDAGTALIDSWACVADVLTFYQERIANEGFLRTAVEQRSVVELGRLTGYEPRPGVAASAHLAFTVQDGFDGRIPERTRAQSMPRPDQTAQVFETSEPLDVRAEWNAMQARQRTTTQFIRREFVVESNNVPEVVPTGRIEIFLAGIDQNVQPGDIVIVEHSTDASPPAGSTPSADDVYRVTDVTRAGDLSHTTIRLVPFDHDWKRGGEWDVEFGNPDPAPDPFAPAPRTATAAMARARRTLGDLLGSLRVASKLGDLTAVRGAEVEPETTGAKPITEPQLRELWSVNPDALVTLVAPGMPELHDHLRALLRTMQPAPVQRAWVLRARAQVFGHNAPELPESSSVILSRPPPGPTPVPARPAAPAPTPPVARAAAAFTPFRERTPEADEKSFVVYLDGEFSALRTGSWLVMRAPPVLDQDGELRTLVFEIVADKRGGQPAVAVQSRRAYGLFGKATKVSLSASWWTPFQDAVEGESAPLITPIRRAVVYAQAEALRLVGEPVEDDVDGSVIDLDRSVTALPPDRLLIVEGDLAGTNGIHAAELVRVASTSTSLTTAARTVRLRSTSKSAAGVPEVLEIAAPGKPAGADAPFTQIALTAPLRNTYQRSSVVIRGNVAHATHGETRDELLGSGDASIPSQAFTLRQGPRTWVSAPTPSGIASTLEVRVSGILWPEVRSSAILGPRDEVVRSRTLSDGRDEIKGGDGHNGARFPTGVENVTARYRVGIGTGGNVGAGLITALLTRPMGVRDVINPLRASGGAGPDGRDQTRARIPIAARGIDRLVSVPDHAAFALNFAGIAKAEARFEAGAPDGPMAGRPTVHVVIAGAEDEPIDEGSDLLTNLRAAFRLEGDPTIQVVVSVADAVPMTLQAGVRIDPRHEFSRVEAAMRDRLLARFGWDARAIGEAAHLSVVLEALQAVDGVVSVDVDVFGPLDSQPAAATGPANPAEIVVRRIAARIAGLRARIAEAGGVRRWSFAAGPDQVLYFARSLPDAVAFQEVTT